MLRDYIVIYLFFFSLKCDKNVYIFIVIRARKERLPKITLALCAMCAGIMCMWRQSVPSVHHVGPRE